MPNNNNLPRPAFADSLFGAIGAGSNMLAAPNVDFIPTDGNGNVQYLTGQDAAQWKGLKSKQMQRWAYDNSYSLASVVDKLATYDAVGIRKILRSKGKGANDLATSPYAQRMNELLDNPNPWQSWLEFRQQQVAYKKVYGYCPVFPIIPLGYTEPSDAIALFNIPPWAMNPDVRGNLISSKKSDSVRGWDINLFGQQIRVAPDGLLILKDTYMMDEMMKYVLPKSRLVGLDMAISNSCYAMEAENVMLRKRGAIGFISHDTGSAKDGYTGAMPMTVKQKKRLQLEFARYGTSWHQWQYVISRIPIKWNSTILDVKKLGIGDALDRANKAICHRYHFPYTLFEQQDATYANGENAEVSLYHNNIIPENKEDMEAYESFFKMDENNCCLMMDFSDVAALQEDEKYKWDAALSRNQSLQIEWDADMITMNEWRESNGRDTVDGGDIYKSEWLKRNGNMVEEVQQEGETKIIKLKRYGN